MPAIFPRHHGTARHRAEQERERLIRELQDALAQVKALSGLLPTGAGCRKIRDDPGGSSLFSPRDRTTPAR
ncbi:MAG: hypothetical protein FJ386_13640 [Verrucomicrobia bacterium]|nr:hypothetical protein [Verrucomicrobiota bacterium]